ncbi:recombinase family protein [Bacillus cereus group sp. MYBK44-1]|uniref:recombinase family protein n=1 Tax=Bacillus cereus group sp. MYBK44-1 TaxID=3450625 RepID=UPI003F78C5FA
MIYGYARKSADDQNLGIQIEELTRYGVDEIISESVSGVSEEKEKLDDLIERMVEGDTLVVTRMDRLGRNTRQLLTLVEELNKKNVYLVIKDMLIDTRTPTGEFFLTVMAGFAQLERKNLKIKQMKGIKLAKQEGRHLGRPRKWTKTGMEEAIRMYLNDYPLAKIEEITNIGKTTLYRELRKRGIPNRSL